jgi:hypothetical protein
LSFANWTTISGRIFESSGTESIVVSEWIIDPSVFGSSVWKSLNSDIQIDHFHHLRKYQFQICLKDIVIIHKSEHILWSLLKY